MALILKSNKALKNNGVFADMALYQQRVIADGGTVANAGSLLNAYMMLESLNIAQEQIVSAVSAEWGIKVVDGNITKLYSISGAEYDMTVTKGSYAYANNSFVSLGQNINSMSSQVIEFKDNLSLITSAALSDYPSDREHPINEAWLSTGTGMTNGRLLGMTYNHAQNELSAYGYGLLKATKVQNLEDDVKRVFSVRLSNSRNLVEGFINTESFGTVSVSSSSAVPIKLNLSSQGTEQAGGAKGNYYTNIVASNLTREQHLLLVSSLI